MAASAPDAGDRARTPRGGRSPAQDRGRRRRCGQQRDDDGAVAGRHCGEREGRQQREAGHDPAGDHGEPRPLGAAGQALPGQCERERGENRRRRLRGRNR